MLTDLTKLILTSLVLIVLIGVAFGAGVLTERWTHECPDNNQMGIDPIELSEIIYHVNKQIFIEHESTLDVHYAGTPKEGWEWLTGLGIGQEFTVRIRGRVPVGFDLDELGPQHIWTSADGTRVQVTLPPPQIFEENVSVDFDNSYIVAERDICPNWICDSDLKEYQREALPAAKKDLIARTVESDMLSQAARDGKDFYEGFLHALGFESVDVIVTGYGF